MTPILNNQAKPECCEVNNCDDRRDLSSILQDKKELSSLISVLQAAQKINGYLDKATMEKVSEEMEIPLSHIYGIVTFYSQFYMEPRGKYSIKVCRGTACHVRGAPEVIRTVKNEIGLKEGETSKDLKFTFDTVGCLGACALAPLVVINQQYYGKVNTKKMSNVLKNYLKEE